MSIKSIIYNNAPAMEYVNNDETRIYYTHGSYIYCRTSMAGSPARIDQPDQPDRQTVKLPLTRNYAVGEADNRRALFTLAIINGELHILTINQYYCSSDHYFDYIAYHLAVHNTRDYSTIKSYNLPNDLHIVSMECHDGVCHIVHRAGTCAIKY